MGLLTGLLRGYPFTALMAFMMAFLALVAFVRKMNSLRRRWQDAHVPVIVKPGHYDELIDDLVVVLRRGGVPVDAKAAPWILSLPPRLLERVAGRALGGMVPDHLSLLVASGIEILVYPSDVAISGEKGIVARARAAIASKLTEAPAWLTMSAEAQAIEDRLEAISHLGPTPVRERALAEVDALLAAVMVPFEEWETLYRMRLQLASQPELGSRGSALVGPDGPAFTASVPPPGVSIDPVPADRRRSREAGSREAGSDPAWKQLGRRAGSVAGVAGVIALLATDIAILLTRHDASPPARGTSAPGSRCWPWQRPAGR